MDIQEEDYRVHIKVAKLEEKITQVQRQYEIDMQENRKQLGGLFKRIEESFLKGHTQFDNINARITSLEFKILNTFRIDMKKILVAFFIGMFSFIATKVAEGWFQTKMMQTNQVFTLKLEEDLEDGKS